MCHPLYQRVVTSSDKLQQYSKTLQGAAGSPQFRCQRRQLWILRDADWDANLCTCVILCQLFALRIIAVHCFLESSLVHLIPILLRSQCMYRHVSHSVQVTGPSDMSSCFSITSEQRFS